MIRVVINRLQTKVKCADEDHQSLEQDWRFPTDYTSRFEAQDARRGVRQLKLIRLGMVQSKPQPRFISLCCVYKVYSVCNR